MHLCIPFELFSKIINTEPLKLSLDYIHNINVMEEILAKDSILTLDKEVRGCQKNPQDVCTNKKFTEALRTKCQCLPFQLRNENENVCICNQIRT